MKTYVVQTDQGMTFEIAADSQRKAWTDGRVKAKAEQKGKVVKVLYLKGSGTRPEESTTTEAPPAAFEAPNIPAPLYTPPDVTIDPSTSDNNLPAEGEQVLSEATEEGESEDPQSLHRKKNVSDIRGTTPYDAELKQLLMSAVRFSNMHASGGQSYLTKKYYGQVQATVIEPITYPWFRVWAPVDPESGRGPKASDKSWTVRVVIPKSTGRMITVIMDSAKLKQAKEECKAVVADFILARASQFEDVIDKAVRRRLEVPTQEVELDVAPEIDLSQDYDTTKQGVTDEVSCEQPLDLDSFSASMRDESQLVTDTHSV